MLYQLSYVRAGPILALTAHRRDHARDGVEDDVWSIAHHVVATALGEDAVSIG